ncbi:type II toxin-antitoxin system RelE/ParE family toxin [Brevundimonas sp.]|uniref:type II toxin-antitoxin system RelE/ParE family toxin n=1 Tax=Brevundimonas sp. TaxID=1871086 RepID=UPI002ABA4575|nr:type II toxin-antitoxin system RelE/ParE family toxin [Brevundimonas sp.]MDZ4363440.1 type II toxin-antitoxin system RelE/ParE family toxin [Brevundimonas sp.]
MVDVFKSSAFDAWMTALKDRRAVARIQVRIDRLALGNPGDVRPVGHGISELRIDHGPGYRVYFAQRGTTLVILLCGGDKSTQARDIAKARIIDSQWTQQT